MRKIEPFPVVVVGILAILTVLFLIFGHLKHEREEELARLTGNDEQTQSIRKEADQYRLTNRNQQRGILAVAFVVVLVVVVWRVGQRKPKSEWLLLLLASSLLSRYPFSGITPRREAVIGYVSRFRSGS